MKKTSLLAAVLAVVGTIGFGTVANAADSHGSAPRTMPTSVVSNENASEGHSVAEPMATSIPNPDGMVGMPSPMHDFETVDQAAQYMGINPQLPKVLPVGFNIESVTTIEKDILQITYAYQPGEDLTRNQAAGTRINYRVGNGTDDISGDYNHYNVVKTVKINGAKVTFKGGEYMVRLATWVKDGQTHAIAFERPVTRDMATAIIQNVQVTKQHSGK